MGRYTNKWDLLLGNNRFRVRSPKEQSDARDPFEDDYGRLISSAEIRRLQGKTQVFPLPGNGYPRTRLTHSLEVSYMAGSLGKSIEKIIEKNGDLTVGKQGYLSSLLRVSGLIHDIGNTPFGHFGEKAIKDFFIDYFNKNPLKLFCRAISRQEVKDLENFDGNVQSFRLLSRLHYLKDNKSFNLTYQTLSSIVKYPCNSLQGNRDKGVIARKKYGFFRSEEDIFKEIDNTLQLQGSRNPITYILEAADDIAYRAADIEDSVRQGILSIDEIESLFSEDLIENKERVLEKITVLKDDNKHLRDNFPELYKMNIVQQLRIFNQTKMIRGVIESFSDNYSDIMEGKFNDELIKSSSSADICEACKKLFGLILRDKSVLRLETAGYTAIRGLLSMFAPAILDKSRKPGSFHQHLYDLISQEYRCIYENSNQKEIDGLHLAIDYISGMTDEYAIDLYQRLSGIRI